MSRVRVQGLRLRVTDWDGGFDVVTVVSPQGAPM